MSNLQLALQQFDLAEKNAKQAIEFGNHLTALESNKDFQALMGKLDEEALSMTKALAYPQSREAASGILGGISRLYCLLEEWKRENNEAVRFLEQAPQQRQDIIEEHKEVDTAE